jgi:hypothetical protein
MRRPDMDKIKNGNTFGFSIEIPNAFRKTLFESFELYVFIPGKKFKHPLKFSPDLQSIVDRKRVWNEIGAILNKNLKVFSGIERRLLKELTKSNFVIEEKPKSIKDLTSVEIPVGVISADESAIVGKTGHFFLYKGGNNLANLYEPQKRTSYVKWNELIAKRSFKARSKKIDFLQVVIPEKQTVLSHAYPLAKPKATELLISIDKTLGHELQSSYIVPFVNEADKLSDNIYRKTDTHFSTSGAEAVVKQLLSKLRLQTKLKIDYVETKQLAGDLGSKFLGPSFYEEIELYMTNDEPILTDSFDPCENKHIGIMRKWENSKAPNNQKVIVFGNSFFERGSGSTGLSWWFSRLFSEFHFYWSPECDWDIVEKEKPDILICQTIERFLTRVPNS